MSRSLMATANLLDDVTRRANKARSRLTETATWREYIAFDRLAEQQQILAGRLEQLYKDTNNK